MRFRLVPKSMTLDDLKRPKSHFCRNEKDYGNSAPPLPIDQEPVLLRVLGTRVWRNGWYQIVVRYTVESWPYALLRSFSRINTVTRPPYIYLFRVNGPLSCFLVNALWLWQPTSVLGWANQAWLKYSIRCSIDIDIFQFFPIFQFRCHIVLRPGTSHLYVCILTSEQRGVWLAKPKTKSITC